MVVLLELLALALLHQKIAKLDCWQLHREEAFNEPLIIDETTSRNDVMVLSTLPTSWKLPTEKIVPHWDRKYYLNERNEVQNMSKYVFDPKKFFL